jgi:hypothetical protein
VRGVRTPGLPGFDSLTDRSINSSFDGFALTSRAAALRRAAVASCRNASPNLLQETPLAHPLFERNRALLDGALDAIRTRGYWSAFPEQPSPKVYGETANEDGKAAVLARLGKPFELDQPGARGMLAPETSPYGVALNVAYPQCDPQALVDAGLAAMPAWQARRRGPHRCVPGILDRLNKASFEIAWAVLYTTGQGFG